MKQFRNAVENRDIDTLVGLVAEDVVFRSPVVYKPYEGRDQVALLLAAVGQVLEDFQYTREIGAPDAADSALVFRARIGDREVEGCDFIHVNENGLIDELYVMFRPLSGVTALAEAMRQQLEAAAAGG
ncbi:MAG: nuclear transport factor 2 family protein [Thermoleophilaceae bacterium]